MQDALQLVVGLACVGAATLTILYLESEHYAMTRAALAWGAGDPAQRWFIAGWRDEANQTTDNRPFEWSEDLTQDQMQALCAYNSGRVASRSYPRIRRSRHTA